MNAMNSMSRMLVKNVNFVAPPLDVTVSGSGTSATTIYGSYTVITTTAGIININTNKTINIGWLCLGGGGCGGGPLVSGGAGGALNFANLANVNKLVFTPANTYTLTVGAGGIPTSQVGGTSTISGADITTITSLGGMQASLTQTANTGTCNGVSFTSGVGGRSAGSPGGITTPADTSLRNFSSDINLISFYVAGGGGGGNSGGAATNGARGGGGGGGGASGATTTGGGIGTNPYFGAAGQNGTNSANGGGDGGANTGAGGGANGSGSLVSNGGGGVILIYYLTVQ
jgi:hypothetical protein